MPHTTTKPKSEPRAVPLIKKGIDRLKIWEKAEGMWEHRKPDPIKELEKIRKEWDRPLPDIKIPPRTQ